MRRYFNLHHGDLPGVRVWREERNPARAHAEGRRPHITAAMRDNEGLSFLLATGQPATEEEIHNLAEALGSAANNREQALRLSKRVDYQRVKL